MQAAISPMTVSAPHLDAKKAPWMERMLADQEAVRSLVEEYGSPLHVVCKSEFDRNVRDLLKPIHERGLQGNLYFARKANKLKWFVESARDMGIGVDTASASEVEECLQLGVRPGTITLTAIGKDRAMLELAVRSGCIIILDNFDELKLLKSVCQNLGLQAQIGLRFSGFRCAERVVFSRFGFALADAPLVLHEVAQQSALRVKLLHAHIDRYDTQERASAARQLLELIDVAREKGIDSIEGIDLGGGILIRYLEDKDQFDTFKNGLAEATKGNRPFFTYQSDTLSDLYPAWNSLSKERFIATVLDDANEHGPLYKQLVDRKLSVYFEPGRALLDNTGMTFAKVVYRKKDTQNQQLVGVMMNRMNLRPFRAEFCSDPVVLADGQREQLNGGAFLVGNLCSESDLIFRRKLDLPFLPELEDVFCFLNTAGYLAHHMEIGTHGNPLPANVLWDDSAHVVRDVFR